MYEALKKSTEVYEKSFAFNTLIAASMEALNALDKQDDASVWSEGMYILLNLLEPIIPHVTAELSERLFDRKNLSVIIPIKEEVFVQDTMTLAVTINGKKRTEIAVSSDASKEEILMIAREAGSKWLEGMTTVKEIIVPGKLVNLVVKPT